MLTVDRIGCLNGADLYYLSCGEPIQKKDKIYSKLVKNNTSELFCYDTTVPGIYSFGCKQLTDGVYHEAGYVWSSRSGCINGQFGMQLIEVVINGVYRNIDINVLKPLVEEYSNKEYDIQKFYFGFDKDKEEPYYKLVEKGA